MKERKVNIPAALKDPMNWRLHRRHFFRMTIAGLLATQIPWWVSCSADEKKNIDFSLNKEQNEIIKGVQEFLFPSDGNGPGAKDLQAEKYLQWVLLDEKMDIEERQYLLNGILWVEETALEEKETSFLQLSEGDQKEILRFIATQTWGESWFSMNLTFIFEALLSDPIYASNIHKQGWNWLEHHPGQPRPIEAMKYGNFLHYINQERKS